MRCFFFFFQAEDGIRDYKVTGVQTCALPISVEDSPIPTVQQGDSLPEALKQAGVVQRVEDFPVVWMDRVVDDHAPETEVTHHRARLRKGLRLGAAKAFLNSLRELLACDHRSSTSSGNNWAPVGLIGLPETPADPARTSIRMAGLCYAYRE